MDVLGGLRLRGVGIPGARFPRVRLPEPLLPACVARIMRSEALPGGIDGWIDAHLMPHLHESLYARAVELLDLHPEDELVEVACGAGALMHKHASDVHFVAGLDHSPMQVAFARKRLADRIAAGTVEIVLGDAAVLPWADSRFSAAVCIAGLEFMPNRSAVLPEMRRVLRPGGRAVFTAGMSPADEPAQQRCELLDFWAPTKVEVQRIVRAAGFEDVEIVCFEDWSGAWGALEGRLNRVTFGTDRMHLVRAVAAKQPPGAKWAPAVRRCAGTDRRGDLCLESDVPVRARSLGEVAGRTLQPP